MSVLTILNEELHNLEAKRHNLIARSQGFNLNDERRDFLYKQLDDINQEIDRIIFALDVIESKLIPTKKKEFHFTNDEKCVSCGVVIPEGRQICYFCESKY